MYVGVVYINNASSGIEDTVSLDLVVMGSVAVSKEGYRIGKGKGNLFIY